MVFCLCIAAISLACGSSSCIAQVKVVGWDGGETRNRASMPLAVSQSSTPIRQGWTRNGVEDGRSRADGSSPYRDTSVGDLLIEHLLGLNEEAPESVSSMRLRPMLRRDQIGVRLQIRF